MALRHEYLFRFVVDDRTDKDKNTKESGNEIGRSLIKEKDRNVTM